MTDQMTPQQMLARHNMIWDMPMLARHHPEILDHLAERYEVHFDSASQVVVLDKTTGTAERFDTIDVRVAVRDLLAREAGVIAPNGHWDDSEIADHLAETTDTPGRL